VLHKHGGVISYRSRPVSIILHDIMTGDYLVIYLGWSISGLYSDGDRFESLSGQGLS
jgi:hypothetical protein